MCLEALATTSNIIIVLYFVYICVYINSDFPTNNEAVTQQTNLKVYVVIRLLLDQNENIYTKAENWILIEWKEESKKMKNVLVLYRI